MSGARQALVGNGPVSIASVEDEELIEFAQVATQFNIHNGLVIASHRARDTEAIITTDGVISNAGYETIWG